jgi:murein DD-endopeptidase MepM/ murein hydrolase activator NlpD
MATFPLAHVPAESYQSGGLSFGNERDWQLHAACDLLAPAGTEIYAVEDGVVWYGPKSFFLSGPQHWDADQKKSVCNDGETCIMTYELAVVHSTFIVRYGEVGMRHPKEVVPGASVSEGQLIAWVGAQSVHTMLHFEMYSDVNDLAPLTQKDNKKYVNIPTAKGKKSYMRRKDLMDPTFFLNNCFIKDAPRPNPGPF